MTSKALLINVQQHLSERAQVHNGYFLYICGAHCTDYGALARDDYYFYLVDQMSLEICCTHAAMSVACPNYCKLQRID